jgi:hypothetical protein
VTTTEEKTAVNLRWFSGKECTSSAAEENLQSQINEQVVVDTGTDTIAVDLNPLVPCPDGLSDCGDQLAPCVVGYRSPLENFWNLFIKIVESVYTGATSRPWAGDLTVLHRAGECNPR